MVQKEVFVYSSGFSELPLKVLGGTRVKVMKEVLKMANKIVKDGYYNK